MVGRNKMYHHQHEEEVAAAHKKFTSIRNPRLHRGEKPSSSKGNPSIYPLKDPSSPGGLAIDLELAEDPYLNRDPPASKPSKAKISPQRANRNLRARALSPLDRHPEIPGGENPRFENSAREASPEYKGSRALTLNRADTFGDGLANGVYHREYHVLDGIKTSSASLLHAPGARDNKAEGEMREADLISGFALGLALGVSFLVLLLMYVLIRSVITHFRSRDVERDER